MGKTRDYFIRLGERLDIPAQAAKLEPITMITGNREVAIECYKSLLAFSQEEITVSVPAGVISVCGSALRIVLMKQQRIVIRGRMECVRFLEASV